MSEHSDKDSEDHEDAVGTAVDDPDNLVTVMIMMESSES